ncbi:MAG: hypothetical protein Q9168_002062 [Polycauliona sp. 1 TL-2023]
MYSWKAEANTEALTLGPYTFSLNRLRRIWREGQPPRRPFRFDEYHHFISNSSDMKRNPLLANRFCMRLCSSIQGPVDHLSDLDSAFELFFSRPFMKTNLSEAAVVERASRLLSQLPATAPDILEALPHDIGSLSLYQLQVSERGHMPDLAPKDVMKSLRVAHHVNNVTLRFALHWAVHDLGGRHRPDAGPVIDAFFNLFKPSIELSADKGSPNSNWLLVCIYLWTTWQRCLMLYLRSEMVSQIGGYDYSANQSLFRQFTHSIPAIQAVLNKQAGELFHQTPYLCGWSFRSLREDRASIAMDFRYFHKVYHSHFGDRQPICNSGPRQCDGSSSQSCKRFSNTKCENQSMHDDYCDGFCPRLFWSRESFLGILGARAVDIKTTDEKRLRYCEVTDKTLTISHVWSHGQGGRPDSGGSNGTGFNHCLHRRYTDATIRMGCESYWMDTACIPSEEKLRLECISQITGIFTVSSKTLICDRDIMTIDVSNPTIKTYEAILATLLVCDWGVRAWTLLEAMRGRFGLYLLCRDNRIVYMKDLLKSVTQEGRVDLITLFLGRDYLFPALDLSCIEILGTNIASEENLQTARGFISIDEAAALLSHRHATWKGDDLLIWSLMIDDFPNKSPVEMWRGQIGKEIRTGSLISSAQRVQDHRGLGWAPYLPTALPHTTQSTVGAKSYPAYDGCETSSGLISDDGLRAKWLVYEISDDFHSSKTYMQHLSPYLGGYESGALLQAMPCRGPRNVPVPYRGALGAVVVVCGSHNKIAWEWKGVYEWERDVQLPSFTIQELLIV